MTVTANDLGAVVPPILVLVVDDDDAVRRLHVRALHRHGVSTREAADGASAIAAVAAEPIDVVLLDSGLPDMSGTDVLRHLRSNPNTQTLPVILVTGKGEPADRVAGLDGGANDYVVKPIDLDELVARVRSQVRGRDAWRSQAEAALHARAALAGYIGSLDNTSDASVLAGQIVDLLVRLPGVSSAAVVEIGHGRTGWLLGRSGRQSSGPNVGDTVSAHVIAEILQIAANDSGVPSAEAMLLARDTAASEFSLVAGETIVVPVPGAERIVGALLLGTDTAADTPLLIRQLHAAVIDLMPVVEQALAPALDRRHGAAGSSVGLREIIGQQQFRTVFQPIFNLETMTVSGFEALSRFTDGVRPDQRFADAARAGMGLELELATLEMALSTSVDLPVHAYLSVNVSAELLVEGRIFPLISLAGRRPMVLEVTEHDRIDDYDAVRRAVHHLGDDVKLSVDDAGSGWASLRHVLSLRPDFVKVDRGWVSEIQTDPARQALLLGITKFAEIMGGAVVAEGVETQRELDAIRSIGIPYAQGFLLGKPAPVGSGLQPETRP